MCLVTGVVERFEDCKYDVNFDQSINVFDNMMIIDVILGKLPALESSECHTLLRTFSSVNCLSYELFVKGLLLFHVLSNCFSLLQLTSSR